MTTTTRDAQALTYLATRLRDETHGCGKWDQSGTYAVIGELVGLNLADTLHRIVGHALDPEARTPGAIKRPFVPKVEKPTTGPLRPDEACRNCGRPKHPANADCDARVPVKTADVSAPVAHLRALRDEVTAELCRHGIPPTNCPDCTAHLRALRDEATRADHQNPETDEEASDA